MATLAPQGSVVRHIVVRHSVAHALAIVGHFGRNGACLAPGQAVTPMTPPPAFHQEYDPEQCATLLRRSPIFKDLPADLLGRLTQLARVHRLGRDALLFAQGDEGDALYAVAEGLIGISIADRGARAVTLSLMEPGDVFGEIALLDGLPRTATARAV